jgi:hypothetical protein
LHPAIGAEAQMSWRLAVPAGHRQGS